MNPTVSIIVPVYNAEQYLSRCVDSILNQEYTDFELILANDGSTDSSGAICDSYAQSDPRVRVIHKENTGVSDTRNQAIDQAHGTYLQFLDSDDWITPDATKLLVRSATTYHCDMVIADFYRVAGDRVSHKGDIEDDIILTREEFASHMMENPADFYYGVIWNKLYRREIIEKNHIRMNTKLSWCEDFLFNLEYILHSETFFALQAPIYYYVKTKGSLVAQSATISNTIRTKLTVFEYYNRFYKHILDEKEYEKSRLQVYRFLLDAAGDGAVPPTILPGSQKLGEERTALCSVAIEGEGILPEAYRSEKLLDRCLEAAALQNDLSLDEARLLLYLTHAQQIDSKKELSDFTGMNRRSLAAVLQKLTAKGLIKTEERRPEKSASREDTLSRSSKGTGKQISITFLPAATPILTALSIAQDDYDRIRFEGFTEEELVQYAHLSEKIKANMKRVLQ